MVRTSVRSGAIIHFHKNRIAIYKEDGIPVMMMMVVMMTMMMTMMTMIVIAIKTFPQNQIQLNLADVK
jgi:hypothetical protein